MMQEDLIRTGLAFLEGFALIISPCILPILPIMLSASITGSRSRPFGIICGFILTFTLFTLFSRAIIEMLHVSPNTLRNVSFIILILLGLVMVSDYLTDKFNIATNRLLSVGSSFKTVNNPEGGFFSGILFGALVGIIWTPCAGPILAAVIVQVAVQKTGLSSLLTVVAFAIGAGLPMLLIALAGRKIINQFHIFRDHTATIRKLLGIIIIASVLAIIYFPAGFYTTTQAGTATNQNGLVNGLEMPYKAPDFSGITNWINTKPLTMADLKGKVVLIDFWTYSCINCIRTLPYLKDWYSKYHNDGLVIVGVHSPEFQFEHDFNNVQTAVKNDGILYPVAMDNNFGTWQNFNNEYWPAHYLINQEGYVVYEHFGEGEYDTTENNIRYLLKMQPATIVAKEENYSIYRTPETYLGFARAENFSSPETVNDNQPTLYTYPHVLTANQWALRGTWTIYSDKITAIISGSAIKLHFIANKVYLVMSSSARASVTLKLNDQPLTSGQGEDVRNDEVTINGARLYNLLSFPKETEGYLEIITNDPGIEMYAFTFG